MAATLHDQGLLCVEPMFNQRVRQAIIAAAIAISFDGLVTAIDNRRHMLAQNVMTQPDRWGPTFAAAIATDGAVGTDVIAGAVADSNGNYLTSGNVAAQALKITDAHISNAVSSVWNAMFGGQ